MIVISLLLKQRELSEGTLQGSTSANIKGLLERKYGADRMSELLYLMSKGPEKFEENQQRMRNQKQAMMNRAAAAALPVKEEKEKKKRGPKKRKQGQDHVTADGGHSSTSAPSSSSSSSSSMPISRKRHRKSVGSASSSFQPSGPSLIVTEALEKIPDTGKVLDEMGVSSRCDGSVAIETIDISGEAQKTKEAMRAAMVPRSRDGKNMKPVDCTRVGIELNVLNDDKFNRIAEKALRPHGMSISVDAVKYLSDGVQKYVKNILEKSQVLSKRRREVSVRKIHENIGYTLAPDGTVTPIVQANLGIKWGLDLREKLCIEAEKERIDINEKIEKCEEALVKRMKEFDTERQAANKKKGSTTVQDKVYVPWWTRDQEMVAENKYDMNQLAMVQWKNEIAEKHSLGPFINRKKRIVRRTDGTSGTEPMCSLKSRDLHTIGSTLERIGEGWTPSPCPIKTDERNIINDEDMYGALRSLPKPPSRIQYNSALDTCLARAQLGVFAPEDPRMHVPAGLQYENAPSGSGLGGDAGGDSKKTITERRGRKPNSFGKKTKSQANLSESQSTSGPSPDAITSNAAAPYVTTSMKPSVSMPVFAPVQNE